MHYGIAPLLLAGLLTGGLAQGADTSVPASVSSREQPTAIEYSDAQHARDWGLRTEEWARYRQLMQGPLGVYSPNLDPLTALGIEARSDDERRRYAELQVQAEAARVEKLLAYQRAYDDAWQRLAPGMQRIDPLGANPAIFADGITQSTGRTAVFVRDDCPPCDTLVQQLQAGGGEFDLYMVGSRADDARIRAWARRIGIDPAKVRTGTITLNHDGGRWLSLGLPGDLPATVRQVNGQWQRQP